MSSNFQAELKESEVEIVENGWTSFVHGPTRKKYWLLFLAIPSFDCGWVRGCWFVGKDTWSKLWTWTLCLLSTMMMIYPRRLTPMRYLARNFGGYTETISWKPLSTQFATLFFNSSKKIHLSNSLTDQDYWKSFSLHPPESALAKKLVKAEVSMSVSLIVSLAMCWIFGVIMTHFWLPPWRRLERRTFLNYIVTFLCATATTIILLHRRLLRWCS